MFAQSKVIIKHEQPSRKGRGGKLDGWKDRF